jgi:hypothetical protein
LCTHGQRERERERERERKSETEKTHSTERETHTEKEGGANTAARLKETTLILRQDIKTY